jgi:actin related protein 2/3 complex subunit 2
MSSFLSNSASNDQISGGVGTQGTGASAHGRDSGSMMYLRNETNILAEELLRRLDVEPPLSGEEESVEPADIILTDFEEAKLRIEVPEDALTIVRVSLKLPGTVFADIESQLNVSARLAVIYGPLLAEPHEGADVTLVIDRRALPWPVPQVVSKVANLRRHVLSWPCLRFMRAVAEKTSASEKPFILRTSSKEPVFILPRADRVVVIFHLVFEEPTDRAIARVIAQELTEANRQVNNAPPCAWSEKEIPLELKSSAFSASSVPRPSDDEQSIGYITFSVFPGSFKTDTQREAIAAHVCLFRAFLTYHLKSGKTYLHARMRNRTETLQKVLNRAIPDSETPATMKLASGKTFVRK